MLITDDALLREPNLLIPGKKPVGPVKIDWDNPLAQGLSGCYLLGKYYKNDKDLTGSGNVIDDIGTNISIKNTVNGPSLYYTPTSNNQGYCRFETPYVLDDSTKWTMQFVYLPDQNFINLNQVIGGNKAVGGTYCWAQTNGTTGITFYHDGNSGLGYTFPTRIGTAGLREGLIWWCDGSNIGMYKNQETSSPVSRSALGDNYTISCLFSGYIYDDIAYHVLLAGLSFFIWEGTTLNKSQCLAINADPYQFLIPA